MTIKTRKELEAEARKKQRNAYKLRYYHQHKPPPRKKRDLGGLSKDHTAYMRFYRANLRSTVNKP